MPFRAAAVLLLFAALSPREESCHFEVTLEVKGSASRQEARRSAPDLPGKLPPRPLLRIRAGEEVTLKWNVLAFPQNREALKDITIHSYLARQQEAGQERPPALDSATVLESALLMDFERGDSAQGTFKVRVEEPGDYLVRVETLGVSNTEAHEHSAQIDLRAAASGGADAPGGKEAK